MECNSDNQGGSHYRSENKAMNIAKNKLQEGRGGEKGAATLVWRSTVAQRHSIGWVGKLSNQRLCTKFRRGTGRAKTEQKASRMGVKVNGVILAYHV